MRFKDADGGEVAVTFGEIETVTDDETVGDLKPHEVGFELNFTPAFFVEEDAGAHAGGILFFDQIDDDRESFPGVEDVVDEEDVAASDIEREAVKEVRFAARPGVVAVAGDADAVEPDGIGDLTKQIGGEEDGAVDDRDDSDLFFAVGRGDVGAQFFKATFDRSLAHEDSLEIVGLSGGRLRSAHRVGVKELGRWWQLLPCDE